ncbi:LysR family transcriptional regulator [Pseudotabrizicola sp. 4114]|uniref:LysR family transcriptional regulator n=1 Tax=Pseudotabrizicola sp. 4114 TaxID=2817731 RepID=UPI002856D7EF|nr:DNA-binding transcriptional LysR family regulator [Pseudorhodobacter sp. 4114]
MVTTLSQLRYFVELARTGHFGRAAERLNMAQPPLSRQIAALEDDLGAPLFLRNPRGVTLTAAGQQFLTDTELVLQGLERAQRTAKLARDGQIGQLTLGFTMCAAYSVVPEIARRYRTAFPQVQLRMREMVPPALEVAIENGQIDVGITLPGFDAQRLDALRLISEPLCLALPGSHPLAAARRINLDALSEDDFVIVQRDQSPFLHDMVLHFCANAGFVPRIGLEVYLQQTIVNLVAEGLGVAMVPNSMQRSRVQGVHFKKLSNAPLIEQYCVWSPLNVNPSRQSFLDVARQTAQVVRD